MGRIKEVQKVITTGDDSIDKYVAHLIEGKELSEAQERRFKMMLTAKTFLVNGYSIAKAIKYMQSTANKDLMELNGGEPISQKNAYRLVYDALKVFGDASNVSREGLRYVMYENFMRASQLAQDSGDYNAMIRALENASRLYKLFDETADYAGIERFLMPVPVIITSDTRVLSEDEEKKRIILEEIDGIYQRGEGGSDED